MTEMWQKCSHIRSASCQPSAGCGDCLPVETLRRSARSEVGGRREVRRRAGRQQAYRVPSLRHALRRRHCDRRSVTRHARPPTVPSRVPALRSDGYILLRDDIVMIEADTYAVADLNGPDREAAAWSCGRRRSGYRRAPSSVRAAALGRSVFLCEGEEHRNAEPADKVQRESAWTGGGTAVLVSGRFEVEGAISRVEGDADPTSRPAHSTLTPACLRGRRKLL